MTDEASSRRLLITGVLGGVGRQLAQHFRDAGDRVVGIARQECDLSEWDQCEAFFDRVDLQSLDAVVHCAARNRTRLFHKQDPGSFRAMVEDNIIGTYNLLRFAIPRLKEGGGIVLFSSSAAFAPRMSQSAYACCKAALRGLVRTLALEMAVERKYIFEIAPGLLATGMGEADVATIVKEKAKERTPIGRLCEIGEICGVIECLLKTPSMSGQVIHLNGGYFIA